MKRINVHETLNFGYVLAKFCVFLSSFNLCMCIQNHRAVQSKGANRRTLHEIVFNVLIKRVNPAHMDVAA